MSNTKKIGIGILVLYVVIGAIVAGVSYHVNQVFAGPVVEENLNTPANRVLTHTFFSATSTTATSTAYNIQGAKKVTLIFAASATSSDSYGTREFRVNVSSERNPATDLLQTGSVVGNEYVRFNKLIDNVTNTNAQELTRVSSVTFTVNGGASGASNVATTTRSMDLAHDSWLRMSVSSIEVASTSEDVFATVQAVVEY